MKTAACIAILALAASACSKNDTTQTPDDVTPGTQTATATTPSTQMPAVETAAPNEIAPTPGSNGSTDSFGNSTTAGNGANGNGAADSGATGNGATGATGSGATGNTVTHGASASNGTTGTPARPDADNTRVNERDRGPSTTPMDQGNNDADLKITQKIRQAVMGDGGLSFTAKNVKIITNKGTVVLRGPVKSDDERARIDAAAKTVAGASNVINEIEIKK